MNIGRHLFRARQLPAYPVREQQHVMLQDRTNQDVQHNIQQDNIAYNRRLYDDPQVMSPNRPEEDAPMVNPLNGPQNEQRGPEVLYQQNTLIQQVVHFEYDPELRHLVQGNDASIEQIIQEIIQIKRTMGHMSQVLTEAFAGVRGDAQNQNKNLHDLASQMVLSQTRLQEISAEITRASRSELEPLKERCRKAEFEIISLLRRVQEAQEGASRVPELERELKFAKERIEKLELRGVQTTEMHQQSMNQLGERIARLETQPQPISQLPGIRESCDKFSQGGARKTNPGAPNLGPGPQWRHLGPGRSSELGKPSIGYPGRAKHSEGSLGGAEPTVQYDPEPVSWTPKGSRKTARKG